MAKFILVAFGRRQTTTQFKNIFFWYNTNFKYSVLFYFSINHQSSSGNSTIFISTFSPRLFFALGICAEMICHVVYLTFYQENMVTNDMSVN